MRHKYSPFGYVLGLVFKGARETIEEQMARRELEQKLGRKVSKEELYSLGTHLDATAADSNAQPLKMTQRESATPFADAKPPMATSSKLLIAGVILLVIGFPLASIFVKLMPEHWSPFYPKPPENSFPAKTGNFELFNDYKWRDGKATYDHGEHFETDYSNGTAMVKYKLWNLKTEEELQARFDDLKKTMTTAKSVIADDKDSRYAVINPQGGASTVIFKNGLQIKQLSGSSQAYVYTFEGLLKNEPPLAVVAFTPEAVPTATPAKDSAITITKLLDDYKNDSAAADKKYKGKVITISGTVEVSDKDRNGNPLIGFMRPGSTKPTDGMVVCGFDKSQEASVSKIKKGDTVKLSGKVMMSLVGSVTLENCKKQY